MRRPVPISRSLAGLAILAFLLVGCATTSSAPSPAERAAVVGVWEYRTSGSPHLGRGTLHIRVNNGRLHALLQDTRRGRMNVRVSQRGSRIEFTLDQILVSGRVEDDRLVGLFRHPTWDVSTSQNVRGRQANRPGSDSGSIVARRVQNPAWIADVPGLGCPSILEEANERCDAP